MIKLFTFGYDTKGWTEVILNPQAYFGQALLVNNGWAFWGGGISVLEFYIITWNMEFMQGQVNDTYPLVTSKQLAPLEVYLSGGFVDTRGHYL